MGCNLYVKSLLQIPSAVIDCYRSLTASRRYSFGLFRMWFSFMVTLRLVVEGTKGVLAANKSGCVAESEKVGDLKKTPK